MKNYYEEDQKLFQAVSELMAGNTDSYYVMYDLSIKYIYKIVYDIVKDYHTTEDLVQETYLTIYNKINTLQDVTKFYSWAGRIATNLTLRYIQKNNRELLMLDSEDGAAEFAFEVATQDNEEFIPENILMDREKQRLITEIVDGLSVEQKITVQYFYYEEMSVTEIAEAMECSRGTVMSRLNYARKAIKAAVVDLAENKGTRLYSLSALPLFHILFRYAVDEFMFAGAATAGATMVGATTTVMGAGEGTSAMIGTTAAGEGASELVGSTLVNSGEGMATMGMSAEIGKGVATGGASSAGNAVAAGVGKGILGKVGATLGGKIAVGLVSTGLVVAGGLAIHNAVTKDDKPKTVPMVINMESCLNTDTVDDADDRFTYEYITVKQDDEDITIGYDSEIYQYGFDNYEALSPELEELHRDECERVIMNPDNQLIAEAFGGEIEFTIDGEDFTFRTTNINFSRDGDNATIVITGECEVPDNAEEIYEKYHTAYEEKLAELIEEATAIQAEWDAKNELVREYFMGVLQDFYLYNTDPFGNKLEYVGDYSAETTVAVTEYAIADVDGDGLVELVVRLNQGTQGEITYGYNPDTQVVVEEHRCGGGTFVSAYDFYDSGFVVQSYLNCIDVIRWDENTDVYNKDDIVWGCIGIAYYVYGEVGSYAFLENLNNPDYIAQEEELLDTYDKDGDGNLWVEVEYNENHERNAVAFYDNAEYAAKINQAVLGGKKVELEFFDISTIAENIDMTDMGNNQYMKIVEDFYLYQTDPFGNYYEHEDNRQGWSETYDYAICDMDGDGVDELIIRYGSYIKIYEYGDNNMQVKEEYSWTAEVTTVNAIEFYENGYYMFHYDGIEINKWDAVSGGSEYIWDCCDNWSISWYQSPYGKDRETESEYLALYDEDGDGTIYYEEIVDENYMVSDVIFYDNAELEAKISEYTGGSKPLDIQFIDMSTVVNQ